MSGQNKGDFKESPAELQSFFCFKRSNAGKTDEPSEPSPCLRGAEFAPRPHNQSKMNSKDYAFVMNFLQDLILL